MQVTYPNMMELFENLGVDMETSDMSFSVSLDDRKGCEWGSRNGLSSLFAQKKNLLNPYFWQMIREIVKFKDDVIGYVPPDWLVQNANLTVSKHYSLKRHFCTVILRCLRTIRTLIAMKPWGSLSSHMVTQNSFRKLIS